MIQAVKDLSGEQLKESVNIVKKHLQEQIPICEQAIEFIEKGQWDEQTKDRLYAQIMELGQKIIVHEVYWMLRSEVTEGVAKMKRTENKDINFMNSWILDNKLCIEEADRFIKSGFVHRCLQRI